MEMNKHGILEVGQKATLKKAITQDDVAEYVNITGDTNPIFVDVDYSRRAGFEKPVVPPSLVFMILSNLLGTRLPGRGVTWLKGKTKFLKPVYPGEEITGMVEVTRVRPEKQLVNLKGVCTNAKGETVCETEVLMLAKDLERVQDISRI